MFLAADPAAAVVCFVNRENGMEVRWADGRFGRAGSLAEAMALAYARLPLPPGVEGEGHG